MSDARVWKFCIAVNLTYSLKQFINFETNLLLSETLNQVLNSLQWDEQNQRELAFLRDELDQVLIDNSWTISCIEKDLIDLPLQQKIFCAADKIMILKDLPSRICSIKIKENENSYFLVAALLENGKALYHWKDEDWYKIGFDKSMPDEPHYFYFCEAPLHDIERILNSKCYEKIYSLLRDSHTENESLLDISEASEINQRASIDESKESNEIIEKGVKDTKNQELQTEIDNEQVCKLKLSIKNLQQNVKKLEGSNQKSQNLINSLKHEIHELKEQRKASEDIKNKYESEIANLEKEKKEMHDTIQLLHNQGQQMSAGHNFQLVQLEKLNHDLVYENESLREECRKLKESQIIELPPNRKHGLPNLGNTCYLNSLLQIFSSTPAFEAALQSLTQPFSKSLKDLLLNMKKDNSPRTIGGLTKLFLSNLVQNYPFVKVI
ncbi:unnamed protein product [Blepharisma stoltei]|uniref:USP domain-containing protein n=1 Tax=Blepharisma stoltei TaxID=1481888 RepID=A0AAU9JA93_9CILI|nr:unnamed protein product [Blepharisma stoltei]